MSRKKNNMDTKISDYNNLSEADKLWLKKFNNEYERGFMGNNPLHPEALKEEAYRNSNRHKQDAMYKTVGESVDATKEFLEDAYDEFSWRDVYKVHGFQAAYEYIVEQTERDLDNKLLNRQITLGKFLLKYMELKRTDSRRKINE